MRGIGQRRNGDGMAEEPDPHPQVGGRFLLARRWAPGGPPICRDVAGSGGRGPVGGVGYARRPPTAGVQRLMPVTLA